MAGHEQQRVKVDGGSSCSQQKGEQLKAKEERMGKRKLMNEVRPPHMKEMQILHPGPKVFLSI